MKIVLISLFILLLIYLIIYMIGGASDHPPVERHPGRNKKTFRSALILDGLSALEDKDLYRLKDDLQDIKALLERNQPYYTTVIQVRGVFPKVSAARTLNKLGSRELIKKIRRDINRMDRKIYAKQPGHFSKGRIILVQILLVIITVLMIIL